MIEMFERRSTGHRDIVGLLLLAGAFGCSPSTEQASTASPETAPAETAPTQTAPAEAAPTEAAPTEATSSETPPAASASAPEPTASPSASPSAAPGPEPANAVDPAPAVDGVPGANLTMTSVSADGLELTDVSCKAEGLGFLGAVVVAGSLAKKKGALKACGKGASPRVFWSFAGGSITSVRVDHSDARVVSCVTTALKNAAAPGTGTCAATLSL